MKGTKLNKVLVTVLCFALMASMSATVFALTPNEVAPNTNFNGSDNVVATGNKIRGVIQVVGILVSVGILMVLGIKYMMGSAEEKAEYKKTFIPYIIGAVLVFAASALANIIYNAASSI